LKFLPEKLPVGQWLEVIIVVLLVLEFAAMAAELFLHLSEHAE